MDSKSAYVRMNVANDVDTKVLQVLIDPFAEHVTHSKFQYVFPVWAQSITILTNREVVSPVSPVMCKIVIRMRGFTSMKPPEFHGLKVDDDSHDFIDEGFT